MHARAPVLASAKMVNRPEWNEGHMNGNTMMYPHREIWIRSGGKGSNGSGPSGWKTRKSKVLARSLAERSRK